MEDSPLQKELPSAAGESAKGSPDSRVLLSGHAIPPDLLSRPPQTPGPVEQGRPQLPSAQGRSSWPHRRPAVTQLPHKQREDRTGRRPLTVVPFPCKGSAGRLRSGSRLRGQGWPPCKRRLEGKQSAGVRPHPVYTPDLRALSVQHGKPHSPPERSPHLACISVPGGPRTPLCQGLQLRSLRCA